jgi:isopenicillin-N N-acyltransferase like protein
MDGLLMSGPLLEVAVGGSPYAMGRQHGEACAALIHRVFDARMAIVRRATALTPARAVEAGLRYLDPVASRFPHLVDEVRGIADGAKMAFPEAFFIQVATEIGFRTEGCSALAVRAAGGAWFVAQNWDVPRDVAGAQIVLRVHPDDAPAAVMFTYAGVIGYMGINERGVCHVANQLVTPDWRPGVTHYFVKRRFLEVDSVEACLQVVAGVPISSSASYVIGDGRRVVALEWLPSGTATIEGDRLAHTNHILDPSLVRFERYLDALPDSPQRLSRLERLLPAGDATLPAIVSILSDHDGHPSSICRHGGHGDLVTQASVIFEPARRVMHVAYGNPCVTPFVSYPVVA